MKLPEIPPDWRWKRLKYVAGLQTGITLGKDYGSKGTTLRPYLRVANVQDGYLDLETITEIAVPPNEASQWELRAGDVLMTEGGDYDKLGRGYVWTGQIPGCLHQNHVFAVRPDADHLNPHFLAAVTASHHGKAYFTSTSQQTTNLACTNSTKIREFPLPLPTLDLQNRILSYLARETARIDSLIEKKERLITLLEEKRAALINRAVTKGIDRRAPAKDSGIPWLGAVPAHWRTGRLKYACTFVTSGSRGWAEHYSDDGPVFLRIGNLTREGIDLELFDIQRVQPPLGAEGERTSVAAGDLLVSITADIGSIAIVPEDLGAAYVNQHLALVRLRPDVVSPRFAGYALRAPSLQSQFRLALYGGTKQGLGLDDVANLWIPLPPLLEQIRIARYLDDTSRRIGIVIFKIREQIARFHEYHTALISAAVSGKIDVRGSAQV